MAYTPPATPWQDLPSEETPVTAAWLSQVDDTLVEHDEILADLEGAANLGSTIDAKGDLLAGTANDTVGRLAVGSNGRTLTAASGQTTGLAWEANPVPAPVTLSDSTTNVSIDASAGKVFDLTAASANRTLQNPTNAVDGRSFVVRFRASGGARTLSLTSGSNGSYLVPDAYTLSATPSGTVDYLGFMYDGTKQRWVLVGYVKGA